MTKLAVLINLKGSRRSAFVHGFWKGLTAPSLLYTSHALPDEALPMQFTPLKRSRAPALSDWVKVGNDLRAAARKEREQAAVEGG